MWAWTIYYQLILDRERGKNGLAIDFFHLSLIGVRRGSGKKKRGRKERKHLKEMPAFLLPIVFNYNIKRRRKRKPPDTSHVRSQRRGTERGGGEKKAAKRGAESPFTPLGERKKGRKEMPGRNTYIPLPNCRAYEKGRIEKKR